MASAPATALTVDPPPIPAVSSEEGFFGRERLDTTWSDSWSLTLQPSAVVDDTRMTFQCPKLSGNNFAYLNRMSLKMTFSLTDPDGKPPTENLSIAPVNFFPNVMFSSVKLFLNETQVTGSVNGLYSYYSYISALISNSTDKKKGYLQAFGYYEDDERSWKQMVERDSGWSSRRSLFGDYKEVTTNNHFVFSDKRATLFADLLTEFSASSVPMINQVGIRVELLLNKPEFYLQSTAGDAAKCSEKKYKLNIHSAELSIPIKTMTPSLSLALERKLHTSNLEYNTVRMDLRRILIPKGNSVFSTDNLKQTASSPDRIYLFLMPESRMTSNYGPSCLRMCAYIGPEEKSQRCYLQSIRLTMNNQSLESSDTATSSRDLYVRKLKEFYENLGCDDTDFAPRISLTDYIAGKFIMIYDLTKAKRASVSAPNVRSDVKEGNLKLEMTFTKPLVENAFLCVMSEYHSKVIVDKNRNVTYRYLA